MITDLIVFLVLALVAIASALGMLFSRNAVYSALFLVVNFVSVAVFFLLLGAPFIAMAQITVYAGAIMVLFLFVIMLLGTEQLAASKSVPWQRPLAALLALILAVESVFIILSPGGQGVTLMAPENTLNTMDSLRLMAVNLFDQFLLPFEITSVLLLVAIVGAIVLTKQERAGPQ